jgi:hypothetical protein
MQGKRCVPRDTYNTITFCKNMLLLTQYMNTQSKIVAYTLLFEHICADRYRPIFQPQSQRDGNILQHTETG